MYSFPAVIPDCLMGTRIVFVEGDTPAEARANAAAAERKFWARHLVLLGRPDQQLGAIATRSPVPGPLFWGLRAGFPIARRERF